MMPAVLVWRLAAGNGNIPYRDERARSVIIGSTEEIPDLEQLEDPGPGVCVWFRVLPAGGPEPGKPGDRLSKDRVVAEVRTPPRARERVETATGMYRALGWVVVEDPRRMDVSDPPMSRDDIMSGYPLQVWAEGVADQFMVRP